MQHIFLFIMKRIKKYLQSVGEVRESHKNETLHSYYVLLCHNCTAITQKYERKKLNLFSKEGKGFGVAALVHPRKRKRETERERERREPLARGSSEHFPFLCI